MEPVEAVYEMSDQQMLAFRFRTFPDTTFRAAVVAGICDHVDQLIAFDSVESSDWRLVPPVNAPFNRFKHDQTRCGNAGFDLMKKARLDWTTPGAIPTGNNGGNPLSGSYQAVGSLSSLTSDASGGWTLLFADLSPGDTSTLTGLIVNVGTLEAS